MNDLISRQVLDLWNRYKPTIAVDAIEYDRELKKLLSTNLASLGTDCISRQAAIDALRAMQTYKLFAGDDMLLIDQAGAQTELMLLPPIQPKRGRWHYSDGKPARIGLSFGVVCDQCGTESEYCTNFCGECGADMREVTNGD